MPAPRRAARPAEEEVAEAPTLHVGRSWAGHGRRPASAADEAAGGRAGAASAAGPAGPAGAWPRRPEPPAPAFDVGARDVEFLAQVLECLMTKAFCVVDARELEVASKPGAWRLSTDSFLPPPSAPGASIAAGLLGREGSALLRPLEMQAITGVDSEDEDIGELVALKEDLMGLGQAIAGELLGLQDAGPTAALLHLSEAPGERPSLPRPLEDELGSEWLQVFCRHRLMVMFFLGPGTGVLELGLYDDEAQGVQRVATGSGVLVVLRPEVLSRCHVADSDEPCLALSFFMLTLLQGRGPAEPPLPPYAEALVEWMEGRMRHRGQLGSEAHLDYVPSSATFNPPAEKEDPEIFSMDRPEKQARVLAEACKLPSTWSSEAFFEGVMVGADLVKEIPFMRFDIQAHMDDLQVIDSMGILHSGPDRMCKHGSFIDGEELFDNMCFGISAEEVRGLPPSVRSGLEVAHEAMCKAQGSSAKSVLDLPRINADVLVGMNTEDNDLLSLSPCGGTLKSRARGGCCGARADEASRISFALGMAGRSSLFDTDGSSSFAALWQGFSDQTAEHGDRDDPIFTLVLSSSWNLEPLCFSSFCRRGLISPMGRCFCFDICANGMVRAEGCAGVILAKSSSFATLNLNGMDVGSLRGVAIRQSGSACRLGEPAGISMQQVMDEAVQAANASLVDINILEAHSPGSQLFDAMEMGAVERVFPRFMDDETLPVTDVKSVIGSGYAAAGLFALLKVLSGTLRATLGGNSLLKTLNSDIRLHKEDCNLTFLSEALKHPVGSTGLTGINSFGTKGTYVSAVAWADLTRSIPEAPDYEDERYLHAAPPPAVSFWPAGGGELDPAGQPSNGYFLVGSFSQWTDPMPMVEEAPGEFTATIVLGYNRWEQFQIWLDGDRQRALHPGQPKAARKGPVFGPEAWEACAVFQWQVEGRQRKTLARELDGEDDIPPPLDLESEEGGWKWVDVPTRDAGEPGTRYKVCLRVAGKYRTVDWERLPEAPELSEAEPEKAAELVAAAVDAFSKPARYYLMANWNEWTCEEMTPDERDPCIWRKEIFLPYTNGVFVIVRNRDPEQFLYPEFDDESDPRKAVLGPDDGHRGRCWMIREALGETLQIEFRRRVGYRTDERRLCWWTVGGGSENHGPGGCPAAAASDTPAAAEVAEATAPILAAAAAAAPRPPFHVALPPELATAGGPPQALAPAEALPAQCGNSAIGVAEEMRPDQKPDLYVGPILENEAELPIGYSLENEADLQIEPVEVDGFDPL